MRDRGNLRRGPDRILAGVCSGLAEYLHVDPTLVRAVFVVLTLVPPGIGIILYFVFWFLMDSPAPGQRGTAPGTPGPRLRQLVDSLRHEFWPAPGPSAPAAGAGSGAEAATYRRHSGRLWGGIVLIAVGGLLVLGNLGYLRGFRWDLLWPVLLIALGLMFLVRRV